jgi:glycosyltransferase involved in cell wall biosynthesis
MCADKGLDILVDAFIALRRRGRVGEARLRIGGGCGPADEPLVRILRIAYPGLGGGAQWSGSRTRIERQARVAAVAKFVLRAFALWRGLWVVCGRGLAAGVPVVLPRSAAFPELIEQTGGGVLCDPRIQPSLAEALERLTP